ncbi:hypothetical protein LTR56_024683 [Elasticomyces elasticus]|nr:hypothetical protein LTR56_024683 [Elasticomyces elasticus]KAK3622202.1 hypothetical protein LTR22_024904 [Elasticomyces elasticus]KAK4907809.1 hypothetical protein LTR49_023207 [Elasticomyces elasticus]KAK5747972.1 hypothetical protein LTS12_021968 [Elasticomyces elasticus]
MDTSAASFRVAILSGDLEAVERCLANGCSANDLLDNELPLSLAVRNGEEEVAVYLITHGADLSLAPLHIDQPEISTKEALYTARRFYNVMQQLAIETGSDMAWRWLLQLSFWPSYLTPLLCPNYSQSTFGFHMRRELQGVCCAVYHRKLLSWLRSFTRYVPSYCGMYLLSPRTSDVLAQPQRVLSSRRHSTTFLRECFNVVFWDLKGLGIMAMQTLFWVVACHYFGVKGKGKVKDVTPQYGGSSAIRAMVKHEGGSDKVGYALLRAGVISKTDVSSAAIPHADHAPNDMLSFWAWASQLLGLGFNVTQPLAGQWQEYMAIELASCYGHYNIVKRLLEHMSEEDPHYSEQLNAAMIISAQQLNTWRITEDRNVAHLDICRLLLTHSDNVDLKDRRGTTCLIAAVRSNQVALVELLLERGAAVNLADEEGMPPLLHLQPSSNWELILELLLHAGADVNHVSNKGSTILLKYAKYPMTEIVQALLDAGAEPNLVYANGFTAMHHAALFTMTEMMRSLIAAGAHIDSRNSSGRTPLLEACHDWHPHPRAPTLRLLLENGARIDVVDGTGMSPLIHLKMLVFCGTLPDDWQDTVRSIEVLLEHNADVNPSDAEVFSRMGTPAEPLGFFARRYPDDIDFSVLRALLKARALRPGPRKVASHSRSMEQIADLRRAKTSVL